MQIALDSASVTGMTSTAAENPEEPEGAWEPPPIMTVQECARYMRRKRMWVQRECQAGRLKSSKADGRTGMRWIRREHADEYIDSRMTAPAEPLVSPPKRRTRRRAADRTPAA